MHTALRPADAVETIRELSQKHPLRVIGTSFGGAMWDRAQHQASSRSPHRWTGWPGWADGPSAPRSARPQAQDAGAVGRPGRRAPRDHRPVPKPGHRAQLAQSHVRSPRRHAPPEGDPGTDSERQARAGPQLALRGGVDPVRFIKTTVSKSCSCTSATRRPTASGLRPWAKATRATRPSARHAGNQVSGDAVIELAHEGDFKPTRPLRESLKMSRAYVKQTLGF